MSGAWSGGANWTAGVPAGTSDVCITVPGTYTVTLAPWSVGTADPNHNGAAVNSLTLGVASGTGTQTLDIAGQGSTSNSNEQLSNVFLNLAATSVITAHGHLVLDSTDGGSKVPGNPSGGYAAVYRGKHPQLWAHRYQRCRILGTRMRTIRSSKPRSPTRNGRASTTTRGSSRRRRSRTTAPSRSRRAPR